MNQNTTGIINLSSMNGYLIIKKEVVDELIYDTIDYIVKNTTLSTTKQTSKH
jgi:hypothetical protein